MAEWTETGVRKAGVQTLRSLGPVGYVAEWVYDPPKMEAFPGCLETKGALQKHIDVFDL